MTWKKKAFSQFTCQLDKKIKLGEFFEQLTDLDVVGKLRVVDNVGVNAECAVPNHVHCHLIDQAFCLFYLIDEFNF